MALIARSRTVVHWYQKIEALRRDQVDIVGIRVTRSRQRLATFVVVGMLLLGFFCQVAAVEHWLSPMVASGDASGTQQCHGSLSSCAGTVDVGSSLHATLNPPIAPEERPDALDVAVAVLVGHSPVLADPPPQT